MALTDCRECGHEISKSADQCPHCGVSDPGKSLIRRHPFATAIIVLVAIGLFSSPDSTNDGSPASSAAESSGAVQYVHTATNVRAARTTDAREVTTLHPGDSVRVGKPDEDWIAVYRPGSGSDTPFGYVYAPLLHSDPPSSDRASVERSSDADRAAQSSRSDCTATVGDVVQIRSEADDPRVSVARTQEARERMTEAVAAQDLEGYERIVYSGQAFRVEQGTRARVIDVGGFMMATQTKVRILEGSHRGASGWIPPSWARC